MRCIRLRLNYGDDNTPTEASAIFHQKLCEVASLHSQGTDIDVAADLISVPTPAAQSLPTVLNVASTSKQIRAELDRLCST